MIALKLDVNALENLLKDDDGTIKLELQQAVLEEFGRRHVKAFANEAGFKRQLEAVKKETLEEIDAEFGKWENAYSGRKFVLNQTIKDMIQLHAKTVVTYELDQAEKHVAQIYGNTAQLIRDKYQEKTAELTRGLERYTAKLEEEVEKIKAQLLTKQVDKILRDHVRTILAESFATAN